MKVQPALSNSRVCCTSRRKLRRFRCRWSTSPLEQAATCASSFRSAIERRLRFAHTAPGCHEHFPRHCKAEAKPRRDSHRRVPLLQGRADQHRLDTAAHRTASASPLHGRPSLATAGPTDALGTLNSTGRAVGTPPPTFRRLTATKGAASRRCTRSRCRCGVSPVRPHAALSCRAVRATRAICHAHPGGGEPPQAASARLPPIQGRPRALSAAPFTRLVYPEPCPRSIGALPSGCPPLPFPRRRLVAMAVFRERHCQAPPPQAHRPLAHPPWPHPPSAAVVTRSVAGCPLY